MRTSWLSLSQIHVSVRCSFSCHRPLLPKRSGALIYVMTTNCGEKVQFNCTRCKIFGWNDPCCQTCQIYQLKKRIQNLESENAFLRKDQDQQFNLTLHLFYKYGKRYIETPYIKPKEQDNLYFLTITFDPSRFNNLGTNTEAEETYILHQLALATKDQLVIELVGCFELQNNGTTHAHAHVRTYQPIELQQFLKKRFTNNMRNNKSVDLQIARKSDKGMDYINKKQDGKGTENKSWYTIDNNKEKMSEEVSLLNIGVCEALKAKPSVSSDGYLCSGTSTLLDSPPQDIGDPPKTVKKLLKKYSRNLISQV